MQASYRNVRLLAAWIYLHEANYDSDEIILGRYFEMLRKPNGLNDHEFEQLPKKSHSFLVRDGHLYKRSKKRHPPQQAVGKPEQREGVLHEVHEFGHKGQQVFDWGTENLNMTKELLEHYQIKRTVCFCFPRTSKWIG